MRLHADGSGGEEGLPCVSAPFTRTDAPFTKELPLSATVMGPEPAVALDGLRLVSTGPGLLMLNVSGAETPPPGAGLLTVMASVPVVATSVAEQLHVEHRRRDERRGARGTVDQDGRGRKEAAAIDGDGLCAGGRRGRSTG